MRYFTWKLCREVNSRNDDVSTRAHDTWMRNLRTYDAQLRPLLARFNQRNQRFWRGDAHHLHDGLIVRVTIGDAVGIDVCAARPKAWRTSVTMEVIEWGKLVVLCTLKYSQVEAIEARLREGGWGSAGTVFETWGYDELLPEGPEAFRHNILFATGGELSIVFKRFSYTRRRLPERPWARA
jgi:hypothetical protein